MGNILIVTPYFRPAKSGGGGQVSIENLSDTLATDNNVSVLCYNHDFNSNKRLINGVVRKIENINVYYFSFRNPITILKAVNRIKFDFIYINSFFSPICIFFQFYFYFSKSIKIISPKGEFYEAAYRSKKLKKRLFLFIYKFFFFKIRFHATSYDEVHIIKNIFPKSSIEVARDIPSIAKFDDENHFKKINDKFKIIYCSRIDQKKNLAFIADVLQLVKCELILDIFGNIYDQPYFETAMKKFNRLPENIKWEYKGKLDFHESRIKFSEYDLFFFPTKGENYGHVIYESLSCGCPVLLSKDTTPWNELEANNAGFNINLNNPFEWSKKIEYYYELMPRERMKIFDLCKSYVAKKCDILSIKNENKNLFVKDRYIENKYNC